MPNFASNKRTNGVREAVMVDDKTGILVNSCADYLGAVAQVVVFAGLKCLREAANL